MKEVSEDIEFMLDLYNYEKREYGYVRHNRSTIRLVHQWIRYTRL